MFKYIFIILLLSYCNGSDNKQYEVTRPGFVVCTFTAINKDTLRTETATRVCKEYECVDTENKDSLFKAQSYEYLYTVDQLKQALKKSTYHISNE